jgi:hypothetical protein
MQYQYIFEHAREEAYIDIYIEGKQNNNLAIKRLEELVKDAKEWSLIDTRRES